MNPWMAGFAAVSASATHLGNSAKAAVLKTWKVASFTGCSPTMLVYTTRYTPACVCTIRLCDWMPLSFLLMLSCGSEGKRTARLPSTFLYFFHSPVCPLSETARQSRSVARKILWHMFAPSEGLFLG